MNRAATPIIPFAVCCAGVALFSVMDAAMKGLSLAIGLYNALFWRAVAGSVLGLALMLLLREPWPSRAVLRLHVLRGLVVAGMAMLFFWALMRMPIAEAIALSFIAPLIALYLAALLLGETISRQAIGASVLGLLGVIVILSGKMRGSYDGVALLGAGAVLASAVLFAWNLILQRQQAQLASPVEVAFFQHLVMLGAFSPGAPWLLAVPPSSALPMVLLAAGLAFTSLAALAWAYARAQAQVLIPVEYTAFIWAAILGWLAFGERLTLPTLAGAGLIVAGCLLAARTQGGGPATPAPHVEPGLL
ncbi:S-adenosylmethionine uptake transporter [Sphingobium fontiphilum]|uniref:S-adenosylmethionine uptake transporter n=1 Tax=Sphingobium fontiphilum TaxID=944425 RepID=A0A7W6DH41_9SPHN|nr:DMT family transporter [Sphingobium fontiphilum]MBB3982627.1 S-adenosylmethionine uptake transporter [Sphingobium fontiphilum]